MSRDAEGSGGSPPGDGGATPERSGGDTNRVRSGRVRRSIAPVRMAARTAAARAALAAKSIGRDADEKERRRREFHERMADRYVRELGDMKGALMKFGQLLSFVDAGVVPERYRDVYQRAFGSLLADGPSMPVEVLDAVVEDELGAPAKEVFAWFSPEPLASASIGQVHEARLDDGTAVAVKIQYPGVAEAIDNDLSNAELLATFMRMGQSMMGGLAPKANPKVIVSELRERISEELDYSLELRNQQLFGALYDGHPFIRIPKVFEEYSSDRVFTMEFADGLRWERALEAPEELRERWAEVIYRFVFCSLDRYAMFNADPHPGNYIFHEDGTVSFLDFGCVKFMPAESMHRNVALIRAVADGRAEDFKAGLVSGGYLPADDDLDAQRVLEWYRGALYHLQSPGRGRYRFTHEDVAEFIKRIYDPRGEWGDIVRRFNAPKDYTLVSRIDLGVWSVLAGLGATGCWQAIAEEVWGVGPPATELGHLDAEWVARMRERSDWPPAPPHRPDRFTSPIASAAFDPVETDFRGDPYPDYERLRVQGPVHWVPPGVYLVPRYADCFALLRDPRLSSDPTSSQLYQTMVGSVWGADSAVDRLTRRMLLFMDPPDHERMRSLVASAFSRRSIEDLRPQIQSITDELLDAASDRGKVDLVADLAYPLPVRVIAQLLGVPLDDRERFGAWSRDLVDLAFFDQASEEDAAHLDATITAFFDYFRALAQERRRTPADDLLTELVRAEEQGDTLTEDELLATCVLLLIAGHETTANLIGNAVIALLRSDAWERLVREPELTAKAVEELLRFDSPVQATARTTLEEIDIGGKIVPAGERVVLLVGAANRDPVAFVDPDTLRLDRDAGRHLSFGAGIHFCLGAPLARLEAQIAIRTLAARFPALRLLTDEIEWRDAFPIRGPRSLDVTW